MAGRIASNNRFFSLATDSEDEQIDRRILIDEDICSNTASLVQQRNSGRRLRSEHTPPVVNHTSSVQVVPDVPDSHDRRLIRVRAAMRRENRPSEVRRAAEVVRLWRSGSGAQSHSTPTMVSFQHSSNVGAAVGDRSCPVLFWLAESAQHLSIPVSGVEMRDEEFSPQRHDSRWDVFDRVNLDEVCRTRFAVLQSCPFQLRGRFRQVSRAARETLNNGVVGYDVFMETRGWELFILLLLHVIQETLWPCQCGQGRDVPKVRQVHGRRVG